MTPQGIRTNDKTGAPHQCILKIEEACEMSLAIRMKKVTTWVSESLMTKSPAKLLGGMVLGAVIMAATVLPLSPVYGDGPARPFIAYWNHTIPEFDIDKADPALLSEVMDAFGEGAVADFGYRVLVHRLNQAKLEVMETFGEGAVADIGYEVLIPRLNQAQAVHSSSITYWNDSIPEFDVDQADPALLREVMDNFGEGAVADFGYRVLVHRLNQGKAGSLSLMEQ